MASIWDALKQYVNDVKPGGLLSPEIPKGGPTEAAKGLLGFTPGIGDAISGYDAIQSARQGNYGEAALNGLGVLPFIPSLGGMVKQFGSLETAQRHMIELQKARDAAAEAFKANKSREALQAVGKLDNELADTQSAIRQLTPKDAPATYKGEHSAPMKDSGAPLHEVTRGGYYPEDVYGPNGLRYYGTGDDRMDAQAYSILRGAKGNPLAQVKMFRAVPKDAPSVINDGDWVTTLRQYAKEHGEGALNGDYKIVSKTVPAKKLFTNGDSWMEFGYDQSGKIDPRLLGVMAGGGLLGLGAYGE